MEPKRYWWIQWSIVDDSLKPAKTYESVVDLHPFIKMKNLIDICGSAIRYDWKLISAEEYNLWNQLNSKENGTI